MATEKKGRESKDAEDGSWRCRLIFNGLTILKAHFRPRKRRRGWKGGEGEKGKKKGRGGKAGIQDRLCELRDFPSWILGGAIGAGGPHKKEKEEKKGSPGVGKIVSSLQVGLSASFPGEGLHFP